MRTRVITSAATAVLAALLAARSASASPPVFEIAGKAGYLGSSETFGVGGRAGYAFSGFYAGLSLMDYPAIQSGLQNQVAAEAELGYGLELSFVTIRPLLGLGAGFGDSPPCLPSMPQYQQICGGSSQSFLLQPGGLVQLGFGHFIFGVSASALIAIGSGVGVGLEVDGQVGARF